MACFSRSKLLRLLLAGVLGAGLAGLWPAVPAAAPQNQETPEVKSEETTPTFTFRAQRNEVPVRVIVRDAKGNTVGGLTKDDFRLFDNGKPQSLTAYTVENNQPASAGKPPAPAAATAQATPAGEPPAPAAAPAKAAPAQAEPVLALPERYVAFYFDDLVVSFEDMVRMREAAEKFIESSLQPTERAGIFTSSGLGVLDFTADRAKLREALAHLRPRPRTVPAELDCPPLTDYEAYAIVEQHDSIMLGIATWEYIACACGGNASECPDPQARAKDEAIRTWSDDQTQSRQSLRVLLDLVRRLGLLPGQRSVLWLSQGFLTFDLHSDLNELTDRALREHVVISALDSRGLWVDIQGGEAAEHNTLPMGPPPRAPEAGIPRGSGSGSAVGATYAPSMSASLAAYRETGREMHQDVMAQVSHATGGVFIRNTNDYDGGFRKAGALPEFSYLLAFSPQNLKYDGKFHKLKVELVKGRGLSVQARKGYFAPGKQTTPEEGAKGQIREAVFSPTPLQDLPLEMQTQARKIGPHEVEITVEARLDIRALPFRREGDRNINKIIFTVALFDTDGKFVSGKQQERELTLDDTTLANLQKSGIDFQARILVAPRTYTVRVVARDSQNGAMAALSRSVEVSR
ncbi:MAG: VWA domain-containing protein [Terriglobia bacterium]